MIDNMRGAEKLIAFCSRCIINYEKIINPIPRQHISQNSSNLRVIYPAPSEFVTDLISVNFNEICLGDPLIDVEIRIGLYGICNAKAHERPFRKERSRMFCCFFNKVPPPLYVIDGGRLVGFGHRGLALGKLMLNHVRQLKSIIF